VAFKRRSRARLSCLISISVTKPARRARAALIIPEPERPRRRRTTGVAEPSAVRRSSLPSRPIPTQARTCAHGSGGGRSPARLAARTTSRFDAWSMPGPRGAGLGSWGDRRAAISR
jgi:hypothetical protein